MNRTIYLSLAAMLSLTFAHFATDAQGALINVPNHSFENPVLGEGSSDPLNTPDWIHGTTGTASFPEYGTWNAPDDQYPAVPDGVNVLYMFAQAPTTPSHVMTMTSASSLATIQNNATYQLTVAVGRRLSGSFPADNVMIELLAGVTPVANASLSGVSVAPGTFQDLTASFTTLPVDALAGQSLTIRLTHTITQSGGYQAELDNVRLTLTDLTPTAAVPEPASGAALGLGGLMLWSLVRRRRSSVLGVSADVAPE